MRIACAVCKRFHDTNTKHVSVDVLTNGRINTKQYYINNIVGKVWRSSIECRCVPLWHCCLLPNPFVVCPHNNIIYHCIILHFYTFINTLNVSDAHRFIVVNGVNRSLLMLTAVPLLAWGSRDVGGTAVPALGVALARASLIVNKPADDPRPSIRHTESVASRRVSNSQTPNMVE